MRLTLSLLFSLALHVLLLSWIQLGAQLSEISRTDADIGTANSEHPSNTRLLVVLNGHSSWKLNKITSENPSKTQEIATANLPEKSAKIPKEAQQQAQHPLLSPYFTRKEVDRGPQVMKDPGAINGPLELALTPYRNRGYIILELWVNAEGGVDKVDTELVSLEEGAANLVREHFAKIRFTPAMRQGQAVNSRIRLAILIGELEGEKKTPTTATPAAKEN